MNTLLFWSYDPGTIDLVALSVATWVISGLYIWWKAHRRHAGGALVLAAGAICYALLVALL